MITSYHAATASENTRINLTYIESLITGATIEGLYSIRVPAQFIDDSMVNDLRNLYGYNVYPVNNFNGVHYDYVISWPLPESSGTLVFNGQDPGSGGSYVSAPKATIATWLPGTGDTTIEWFQKQTSATSHPRVFSIGPDTSAVYGVSIEGNKIYTWPNGNNWNIGKTYVNTWIHVAIVRSSGNTNVYVDGVRVGSQQSDTVNISGALKDLYIGADGLTAGDGFPGKITNFRWTNSVVYTGSSFTPITSPLTILPQTKLLMLGGTNANPVVDSTGINVLTNFNTTWSSDTPF